MGKTFSYLPYNGEESYAFLGCVSSDETIASSIAYDLVSRNVRLYNEDFNGEFAGSAESIATAIEKSNGVIMFLSEKSINSLLFRNAINYALAIRKPMLCIKLDNSTLAHGMEMQLANVKIVQYENNSQIIDEILSSGIVTQEMIGGGMTRRVIDRKKTYIMVGMILMAMLIFAISAVIIASKRHSVEYILKDVDGAKYVDISPYGEEAIPCLAEKSIEEINMANGGYKNIRGIEKVSAKVIDISDNPEISSLWPLTKIKGLERVKISQDMLVFAADVVNAGIEVEITH